MLLPSIFDDDFVEDLFSMPFGMNNDFMNSKALMNVDIEDKGNEYKMDLELPGFKKEDIKASLKDGYLTINASHNENKDEKDKKGNYIRRERYSGEYSRSFYVGNGVTQNEIKANFEDGVLKLSIPKKKENPQVEQKNYIAIEG